MEDDAPEQPDAAEPKDPPQRGLLGYVALAGALVLAIGVGAYLFVSSGEDGDSPTLGDLGIENPHPNTGPIDPNRPKEGELAPDFALVDARDPTRIVKLSDFRGKAVIVNWYASWCGPCKNEIPAFLRAEAALNGELVILGVDFLESSSDAVKILDEFGATYPAVLDAGGTVAEHYRTGNGVPFSFFVDKEGILRGSRRGEVHEDELSKFLDKVDLDYRP